ncbi:L-type lectin-domain containing receptor kinase IX.1-like [Humulus lupulus]|uniref:L-type lectin-domain containing receptor kinase IX.1-like n=1 Tax=Humulus lupulus TaxID=3486 RepID=UPI002B406101|nr:L-type lectin-domain containing receptor kinase IX.1-like [Humulus lupulus]
MPDIRFEEDAYAADGDLQLTRNRVDGPLGDSYGRVSYDKPVQLWDSNTKLLTDFTTHFTFVIDGLNQRLSGDGLSFFIAPFESQIPYNSSGGYLALFTPESSKNSSTTNPIVAVEFDTYLNPWDYSSYDHMGIDINSISSVTDVTLQTSLRDGSRVANAWVSYNSTSHNLSVFLTYTDNDAYSLSYIVDLRNVLPEKVRVGFSAATGDLIQLHKVHSWSFNSTLESVIGGAKNITLNGKGKGKERLSIGLGVGFGILCCGVVVLGLVWFVLWRKRVGREMESEEEDYDVSMDGEFERGAGPKRFTYIELSEATNRFSEEGKLGEGGFGCVYKGRLSKSNIEVAVKKVSKGSTQGKKEYISEVKIISRLRHRNLVQLIGWCHKRDKFLLVYEYLPNGSLDRHLFGGKLNLPWEVRHKIALGLASSLLYLHEEWEQCVVHRDIKSSNVMLDSNFNAKLGDFGLARLVDHERGSDTTVLAGTRGYMAPECLTTGKSSKESDIYSFGVVALEISCGRKPVVVNEEPSKVMLVQWVWELYGKGQIFEAVDKKLSMECENKEIKCLMVVGLWCCHPDPTCRPSIKQVINTLNFEVPLPSLPPKMPVLMYYVPPYNITTLHQLQNFENH